MSKKLREKAGVKGILASLTAAITKGYVPKQFDRDDADQAVLVLRLGGPRLLFAMHKSHGCMAQSTLLSKYLNVPRFLSCGGKEAEIFAAVRQNIESNIFAKKWTEARRIWIFMVDDTALDPRIRYCLQTNSFLGFCREHTANVNMTFDNYNDLEHLEKLVVNDKIHRAKEVTVGALASMGECRLRCRLQRGSAPNSSSTVCQLYCLCRRNELYACACFRQRNVQEG